MAVDEKALGADSECLSCSKCHTVPSQSGESLKAWIPSCLPKCDPLPCLHLLILSPSLNEKKYMSQVDPQLFQLSGTLCPSKAALHIHPITGSALLYPKPTPS